MSLELGLRAHDVDEHSFAHLFEVAKQHGLTNVQFAPFKFLPKNFVDNTNMFTPGLMNAIKRKFDKAGIKISVLGCYVNIIDNDTEQREKNLKSFKDSLVLSRYLDAAMVATETGSVSSAGYSQDNFTEGAYQKVLQSVKIMAKSAENYGAIMAIEAGINHPIYNNKIQKRLLDEVNSPNVKIIFDLANIMTPDNLQEQEFILNEAEKLFKDYIFEFHIKDFVFENGKKKTVPFGDGVIDAERYIDFISKIKPYSYCILEGLKENELDKSISYIRRLEGKSSYNLY